MLITCPYCGPRDVSEFSYQGDASRIRPDQHSTDQAEWNAYVFKRLNPAGPHREYWQHAGGCRSHLLVVRDTVTHDIRETAFARTAAAAPAPARVPRRAAAPAAPKPATKPAAQPTTPRAARPKVLK